jgi:hypothetical protein
MIYERHQQLLRILRRNLNITSKYREMTTNMFILGVWIKHVSGISRVLHFLSCFGALIQRTFSLGLTPPSSYYWDLSSELH